MWHSGARGVFSCIAEHIEREGEDNLTTVEVVRDRVVRAMKKDAEGNTTPILRHFAEAALLQPGEYSARLDDEHYLDRAMLIYSSREANTRISIHLQGESHPHEFDWDKETEQGSTLQLLWKNMAESGKLDSWALALDTDPSEENLSSQVGGRAVVEPEEEWTWED
eukprot:1246750-Rhodomonas_salina.1